MKVFHYKVLTIVPAFYGFLLTLDRATLLAFLANEGLGEVFSHTSVLGVAMLVGACSLGAAITSLFTGQLCDKLGCLTMARVAGVLWCLGSSTVILAPENVYIVLCKLAKGFGVGILSVSVPLYIFEVLMIPHRALAIGWAAAFGVLGEAAMFGFGVLLRTLISDRATAFRYCWVGETFWGVLLLIASIFLPESPQFLARKGEWVRATASLEQLAVQKNISLTSVPLAPSKFSELFAKGARSKFFFAVAVQLFAHATCVLTITHVYYYTLAFCRLDTPMVETLYGVFFALQFVFAGLSVWVMKSARRKDMIAYGLFLLTIAYTILGTTSYVYAEASRMFFVYAPTVQVSLVPASTVLALTGFVFSISALLISSLALLFTLEVLPCRLRAKGVSVAMSAAWTVDTMAVTLSIALSQLHPFVLFFSLAGVSVLGIVVVVFVYEAANPVEGLPFPLDALGETGEEDEDPKDEDQKEEEEGDPEEEEEGGEASYDVATDGRSSRSGKSSGAGSLRKKSFQAQNFIAIHKRTGENATGLPQFVVTQPLKLSTGRSDFTDMQMKTADTRFSLRRDASQAVATTRATGPGANPGGATTVDEERLVATTDGNRLAPNKTLDSRVTVTGLWSEVSDPDDYTGAKGVKV